MAGARPAAASCRRCRRACGGLAAGAVAGAAGCRPRRSAAGAWWSRRQGCRSRIPSACSAGPTARWPLPWRPGPRWAGQAGPEGRGWAVRWGRAAPTVPPARARERRRREARSRGPARHGTRAGPRAAPGVRRGAERTARAAGVRRALERPVRRPVPPPGRTSPGGPQGPAALTAQGWWRTVSATARDRGPQARQTGAEAQAYARRTHPHASRTRTGATYPKRTRARAPQARVRQGWTDPERTPQARVRNCPERTPRVRSGPERTRQAASDRAGQMRRAGAASPGRASGRAPGA